MIHEIKDFSRIAVERETHTELIVAISGRCLIRLKQKSPASCICCEGVYTLHAVS